MRWWAPWVALSIVACSDVAITSRLELEGEPVRVVANAGEHGGISVGVLGEHTLVELAVAHPEADAELRAQWLDASLEPVGDSFGLGMGFNYVSRWVRFEERLVAQVWADPAYAVPLVPMPELAHFWRLDPRTRSAETQRVRLDVLPPSFPGEGVLSLGSSQFGAGQESKLPIAAIAMHVVLAGAGPPSACGTTANGRVFLALADASTPSFLEWGANLCEGIVNAELHSHNPWLVEGLEGSSVGVLFRVGGAPDGALRWGLLDPDGGLSHAPVVVGPTAESTVDVGFQPRGVALPGGRVLFTDRRASINVCHALRVMSADGRDAADARWQLPCYSRDRYSAGYRIVPAVELVRAPGGALLVWTEHSDAVARFITASLPWDEGIYAALIGPDGRRASEIVRVTDEAATALDDVPRTETRGPISRDFRFGVDVEGDRAVIAWYDRRRGAAGVYARVLRIRSVE